MKTVDGAHLTCDFHTWNCSEHAALAGGFDRHHKWPKTMGGPENPDDLLVLCATHHRRQHALIRAYVEYGTGVQTIRWFSKLERDTAKYAVARWHEIGEPRIYWNLPAAGVYL